MARGATSVSFGRGRISSSHDKQLQRTVIARRGRRAMELHCLRYGVTVGNVQGCYQGFCDSALTEEQLAAFSAVTFDTSVYDAVFCSPRGRCRDTAGALRTVKRRR